MVCKYSLLKCPLLRDRPFLLSLSKISQTPPKTNKSPPMPLLALFFSLFEIIIYNWFR